MDNKSNFIEAENKTEFAEILCSEVQKFANLKSLTFDDCISGLYYLGSINLDYFLVSKGKIEKTFANRKFYIEEQIVFDHTINEINSKNTYEIIVCHAIEGIIRRLISNKDDFQDFLGILTQKNGKSQLIRSYIKRIFTVEWSDENRFWKYNSSEKEKELVEFFPFYFDKEKFKLYVFSSDLPVEYEDKYEEIFSLINIVYDLKFPLGSYKYYEDFNKKIQEDLSISNYKAIKNIISFDKSSFKLKYNNIYFMIYNSLLGISHKIANIENLSFLLNSNFAVESLLIFLFSIRVDLELGSLETINCIRNIINKLLTNNDLSLDELILNKVFYKKKVFCETIIDFLPTLKTDTLFKLAFNPESYFDVVDYKGVIIKYYLKNYIMKIEISRFKSSVELDKSVRNLINTSNFQQKQILLMSLFSNLDFEVIIK